MKNKIAVIVCLVACLTIAASSEYQKKGLEDRVSDLEIQSHNLNLYCDQLNWLLYLVDDRRLTLQSRVYEMQRQVTAQQYQIWNINWFLCSNFDGCTNAVSPPTP